MEDKKTPLHQKTVEEIEADWYRRLTDEERQANIYHRTEASKHAIDKANEDIQHLIRLNKKQMMDFQSYHRQFISLSAFLVVCILAILFHVADVSINIALPETIAQSKIWLWISYPYHFLVNILPKDSFIFDNLSAELVSFWVVVFIYLLILYGLLPASQRQSDEPKWIISYLITYPLAASFMFLFGVVFIVFPGSFLVSLFT